MKKIISLLLAVIMISAVCSVSADTNTKSIRILFTHDIHSHFINTSSVIDGKITEHGGAARLKTVIDQNRNENTVYLDAGDFSMGTLLQSGYSSDAYELRILGELGCDVTTFGNHEFDYGDGSVAKMLKAAQNSGDKLPQLVQSNMKIDGNLTGEQKSLADAFKNYGGKEYTVLTVNGLKVAVFGLFGLDSLECTPTTKMQFENYIESAKKTVDKIKKKEKADIIICLSHSGTAGDGETGEDIDLAREVPDIDVIISGHTHTKYESTVEVGNTVIVSAGEYLKNVGVLDLSFDGKKTESTDYRLIACDGKIAEDGEMLKKMEKYKQHINETYLADEGVGYDDVICRSKFGFMPLEEMERKHQEYPLGNLIADSYIYEAERNGIDDIDVALVGLGTVRGSFFEGDITTGDAFSICSLGVGADGSAGHPLLCAYITGKELKLLVELDASLGPMVSYIKMSYSGLKYTFNTKRVLLDRVTDICIVRKDGSCEEIEDGKLYKVVCNMYAANMLGMLNGLTRGILKIVPKFADGKTVENFYDCSLYNKDGKEIKEWVAFKNYLMSFPKEDGVSVIPERYAKTEGRKNKVSIGGKAITENPGTTTTGLFVFGGILLLLIAYIIVMIATRKKRQLRRMRRKIKPEK